MPICDRRVREVMSHPVASAEPSTMLMDAALTLRAGSIRHLSIVQEGRLVGLVTDRDIQRCAPSRLIPITENDYNAVFADTTVARVMTRDPQTVSPETPLLDAMTLMQQSRLGCLPVIEHDRLVGILTRSDLVDTLQRVLSGQDASRVVESV